MRGNAVLVRLGLKSLLARHRHFALRGLSRVKLDVILRIVGSVLVVVSYIALVHIDTMLGVRLQLLGDGLAVPFFIRVKAWDVVAMIGVLSFVSISKLA